MGPYAHLYCELLSEGAAHEAGLVGTLCHYLRALITGVRGTGKGRNDGARPACSHASFAVQTLRWRWHGMLRGTRLSCCQAHAGQ